MKLWHKTKSKIIYKPIILNLSQLVELMVLFVPLFGLIKDIKRKYNDSTDNYNFLMIANLLLETIDKSLLYKITGILYGCDEETSKNIEIRQIIKDISKIIRDNDLLEAYMILKGLGLFQ